MLQFVRVHSMGLVGCSLLVSGCENATMSVSPSTSTLSESESTDGRVDCSGPPNATMMIGDIAGSFPVERAVFGVVSYTYSKAFDIVGQITSADETDTLSVRFTHWDRPLASGIRVPFGTTTFEEGDIRTAGLVSAAYGGGIYYGWSEENNMVGIVDLLCFDSQAQTVSIQWDGFAWSILDPEIHLPFSGRIHQIPVEYVELDQ